MKSFDLGGISKLTLALFLGVTLAGAPALADKGGNGGNGGNGGAGNSHAGGNGQGAAHSQSGKDKGTNDDSDTDADTDTEQQASTDTTVTTHSYGTINGFLHASANGIKHANANSAVGSVRDAFVKAAVTGVTSDQMVAALQPYSKKTIDKTTVLSINDKLLAAGVISQETHDLVSTAP